MKVSQFSTNPVVIGVISFLLIPALTQAATHVVTEGQSITDALAISASGDSVLVGPGDYHEVGMEMVSGVTLAALSSLPEEYPRLMGGSAETILRCDNLTSGATIERLKFVGALGNGQAAPRRGHGLHIINSPVAVLNCSFITMKASYGAAIFVGKGTAPSIVGCSFVDCMATASGGAISLVGGQGLLLDHCLFEGNTTGAGGGTLNVALQASATVTHCTFVDNLDIPLGQGTGTIQAWDSDLVEISHCIVADGSDRAFNGDYSSTPQLHCSDLTGNTGGDWIGALAGQADIQGNISLLPMFCGQQNGDSPYTLDEDSPCVADCGIMGAFAIGCDGSAGVDGSDLIEADEQALPVVTRLRGNYPNPFNPQTTIAFDLSKSGHAAVDVYDLAGRLVRNLHSGVLAAGPHEVMWNGRGPDGRMSAAGIYFFRLKTETVIDTRRMALVK